MYGDRTYIDTLSEAEVREYAATLEYLDIARERLLAAVPQCPEHGQCVPYALAWIEKAKRAGIELAEDETPRPTSEESAQIAAAIAKVASR